MVVAEGQAMGPLVLEEAVDMVPQVVAVGGMVEGLLARPMGCQIFPGFILVPVVEGVIGVLILMEEVEIQFREMIMPDKGLE